MEQQNENIVSLVCLAALFLLAHYWVAPVALRKRQFPRNP
jgi:hypothetical protein